MESNQNSTKLTDWKKRAEELATLEREEEAKQMVANNKENKFNDMISEKVKVDNSLVVHSNREMDKTQENKVSNITQATDFTNAIDSAKISTIQKASLEDSKFNEDFKNELKSAVLKSAQLEKEKQELEKKNIELQQNYIKTKNELETQTQNTNKWENKQKAREYHYNGLKDIMQFVHIENPMCIPLMYLFALLVSPIYLVWTLGLSPLKTLICGKKEENRPKYIKNAIYTILCITLVLIIALLVYACCHFWFKWF